MKISVLQRNISHGHMNLRGKFPSLPSWGLMYWLGGIVCNAICSNAFPIPRCSSSLQWFLLSSADFQLGPWTDPASAFLSRHQYNGQCKLKPNFDIITICSILHYYTLIDFVIEPCISYTNPYNVTLPSHWPVPSCQILRVLANIAHKKKEFCVQLAQLGLLSTLCATLKMADHEMVTLSLEVLFMLVVSRQQVSNTT